jgi:hypothetical protein
MGARCSDANIDQRYRTINAVRHPVVYTPGDNEWTDCHADGFRPLERLAYLRQTFHANPSRTLGARTFALETQSAEAEWQEFVENQRWRRGRVLFVTLHIVGSRNAGESFRGRTAEDDSAVVRRTSAAIAWLDSAFAIARRDSMRAVVLAIHGNPRFNYIGSREHAYGSFLRRLEQHARAFDGSILFIHGDSHEYILDQPLPGAKNLTRLETFGSPDIGWVRVVMDSLSGRVVEVEPRLMGRIGM